MQCAAALQMKPSRPTDPTDPCTRYPHRTAAYSGRMHEAKDYVTIHAVKAPTAQGQTTENSLRALDCGRSTEGKLEFDAALTPAAVAHTKPVKHSAIYRRDDTWAGGNRKGVCES